LNTCNIENFSLGTVHKRHTQSGRRG